MSLLNRLRPKWQNSDPDVRADAVRQLDKSEVELLVAVAQQDSDPRVRRIAMKKLDSPRPLLEIAEADEDPALRAYAKERARHLLVQIACDARDSEECRRALALLGEPEDLAGVVDKAHFPEVRDAAFEALASDEARAVFVRRGKDPELRARALQGVESPQALKSIVLDEAAGDLALAAIARIDEPSTLESFLELPTLSKAIRRQAFSRLWDLVPDEHPVKTRARRERFETIVNEAEALGRRSTLVAPEELAALHDAWTKAESTAAPDENLLDRFQTTVAALESLVKRSTTPGAASPAPATETPAEPEAAASPGPRVQAIVDGLQNLVSETLESGIEEARAAREGLGVLDERNAKRLDAAFDEAEARLKALLRERAALRNLAEFLAQAEASIDTMEISDAERDWHVIERQFETVDAAAGGELRERFRKLDERLKWRRDARARQEQATHEVLERRVLRLSELAAQDPVSIKDAIRELREAQDFLKNMGPLPKEVPRKAARRRLSDARELLYKRTQETRELEEWKRWANADIQESLIHRVEKLRDSRDIPKIAKELRVVHEQWKAASVAPAEKSEELWRRYKAVRDELKPRCDAFFEKQNQERAENLTKKEALCAEVEALADSGDWNRTADRIKEMQAQWRTLGPVPQEVSDAIWKRFRAACDRFFERRKEHFDELKGERDENLAKKEALCDRAVALQDTTDWAATAEELKKLQAEWRTIGPVPKKKSDAIWKRFRGACDHFFDRFKRRDEIEGEERAKARLAIVDELALLPGELEGKALSERTLDIWNQWRKLGNREANAEVVARFETAIGELVASSAESFRGSELDPASSLRRRSKLVEKLEVVVAELEGSAPRTENLEDLAARMKDALARNTMTGGRGRDRRPDWSQTRDEVHRLRASWNRTAPVGGEEGREMAAKFEEAYRRFLDLKPKPASGARP